MKTKIQILVFLCCAFFSISAQTSPYIVESKLTIQSEDQNRQLFEANTNLAYMILNITTGDFLLNADISTLNTGNRRLDSSLISRGPQPIVFKGNISENLFLFNQQTNDEKFYKMPGKLTINNITVDCIAQFDPVNYGDKSDPKNYRMDFKLLLDPVLKGIIPILDDKINKMLSIEIIGGKLNIQP